MTASDLDWRSWALLMIDVQRDFWTEAHARRAPCFPRRAADLLAFCRQRGLEIFHLRSRFARDRSDWMPPFQIRGDIPCLAGSGGEQTLPFAAERAGESVLIKHTFDAFQSTAIADRLRAAGKRIVLVAGLETSYCVQLTAASACQRGFLPLVVEDACADDPAHDPALTDELLRRFDGTVFWRARLAGLEAEHDRFEQHLARIVDAPSTSEPLPEPG